MIEIRTLSGRKTTRHLSQIERWFESRWLREVEKGKVLADRAAGADAAVREISGALLNVKLEKYGEDIVRDCYGLHPSQKRTTQGIIKYVQSAPISDKLQETTGGRLALIIQAMETRIVELERKLRKEPGPYESE